jgi:hypothetical protein
MSRQQTCRYLYVISAQRESVEFFIRHYDLSGKLQQCRLGKNDHERF